MATTTFSLCITALMEERKLEEVFGERYKEYKRRVPFMLPRIKSGQWA